MSGRNRRYLWSGMSLATILVGALLVVHKMTEAEAKGPAPDPREEIVPLPEPPIPVIQEAPQPSDPPPRPRRRSLSDLRRPRVVVEKSARRLTVLDGLAAIKTYPVVVGESEGDKVREGDRRTPEGSFYICVKNPQSRFTLSLGLSYPNIEDADRGLADGLIGPAEHRAILEAIRAGRQPPWSTAVGGEIMIHGAGVNRGPTLGCVGMEDDAIRELYRALPLGTPVEIRP